jgi:hypothetical protein
MMPEWLTYHPLVHHFIRGWIDGIGGISAEGLYTTGTQEFLFQLGEILYLRCNLQHVPYVKNIKRVSKLVVANKFDVNKIVDWLYQDATVCLIRKRVKANE